VTPLTSPSTNQPHSCRHHPHPSSENEQQHQLLLNSNIMTVSEDAPRLKDEEVVPLMHTLHLERSSSVGSNSKQHSPTLQQRLQGFVKGFTPELLAIALGEQLNNVCVDPGGGGRGGMVVVVGGGGGG
jgi:hypothetical protein